MADSGFKFSRLGDDGAHKDDHKGGQIALGDDIENALHEGDSNLNERPRHGVTAGGGGGGGRGFHHEYETGGAGRPRKTTSDAKKWTQLYLFLIGVVCFLSLVISAIALNMVMKLTPATEKIWTFAIGQDNLNLHYIDADSGEMNGFEVDIIEAVCSFAKKDCRIVTDESSNCWRSSDTGESGRGGTGLLNGWYDGCVGWSQTLERRRTFTFTEPYTKPLKSAFFVQSSAVAAEFGSDMEGKRIGFLDGYADDQHCINANDGLLQGLPLMPDQVFHFSTPKDASIALNNMTVDAIFTTKYVTLPNAVKLLAPYPMLNCSTRGRSVMTRKDSQLESWWNPAYAHVWKSTYYHFICHIMELSHGKFDALPKEEVCLHL